MGILGRKFAGYEANCRTCDFKMHYRLRTLMIVLAVLPLLLARIWINSQEQATIELSLLALVLTGCVAILFATSWTIVLVLSCLLSRLGKGK
jgi:hypothetical protein